MISPVKIWRNQKKLVGQTGKTGKIVSWTCVRVPPNGFSNQAPYAVALVLLENGEKIMVQVVDSDISTLKIGQKVIAVIRRTHEPKEDEIIPYCIKVKRL